MTSLQFVLDPILVPLASVWIVAVFAIVVAWCVAAFLVALIFGAMCAGRDEVNR